jgi:hypothetical protein
METWEPPQVDGITPEKPASRVAWFIMLAEKQEQIESAYIMDHIDRAEFENQLRDLDAKLAIVGLTLMVKPWVKNTARM